ncbi:hypothetical protein Lesp02_69380 [Lentzea sp. NBRC 105346]|uniref:hypothetical protein n=1 Tax=Lentzea sp. NBRC 105346 TaxID=3032205 RepID=UPI0024A20035|nr:hypothetical protein [Lentzea sp. NBRC 105346]GLZ34751.1 hypothetical protein Lesp02_69380 [Lentzea sp. NBRC 105346]
MGSSERNVFGRSAFALPLIPPSAGLSIMRFGPVVRFVPYSYVVTDPPDGGAAAGRLGLVRVRLRLEGPPLRPVTSIMLEPEGLKFTAVGAR